MDCYNKPKRNDIQYRARQFLSYAADVVVLGRALKYVAEIKKQI
jgi:hypothetical protein